MSFWFEGTSVPQRGLRRPEQIRARFVNKTGGAIVAGELLCMDQAYGTATDGLVNSETSCLYMAVDPDDDVWHKCLIAMEAAAVDVAFWGLVVGYTSLATVASDAGALDVALGDVLAKDQSGSATVNQIAGYPKTLAPDASKLIIGEVVEAPSFAAISGTPKIFFNGLSETSV